MLLDRLNAWASTLFLAFHEFFSHHKLQNLIILYPYVTQDVYLLKSYFKGFSSFSVKLLHSDLMLQISKFPV